MRREAAELVVSGGLWLGNETREIGRTVLDAAVLRQVPVGARIYDEATGPAGLVGIAAGSVRLDIVSGPEDPTLFAVATPGFVLSDISLQPGLPRLVAATAGADCTLLVVPERRLRTLCGETPGLDAALTRLVTLNLWTALAIVASLRRQTNRERVAALLLTLAGADLADGWRIDVPQADLAAMAAIGRTTLVQTLRELESLGVIDVSYRAIRIRSATGLVALRDGEPWPQGRPAASAGPIR